MSWKQVIGHDAAVAALTAAWKRGRIGHAYLFVGPHGVGKHTFARELAKALLCEKANERFEACDVCASCKLVAAGTHPDLFMVARPENKIGIPDRRDPGDPSSPNSEPGLLRQLAMKPSRRRPQSRHRRRRGRPRNQLRRRICFLKTRSKNRRPRRYSSSSAAKTPSVNCRRSYRAARSSVSRPWRPLLSKKRWRNTALPNRLARIDWCNRPAAVRAGHCQLLLDDEEIWGPFVNICWKCCGRNERSIPAATSQQWMEFIDKLPVRRRPHTGSERH